MNLHNLKEKLIYAFGGITLLDLLKTNEIIQLLYLHSHVYISTANLNNNILNEAATLGYIKSVNIVNFTDIPQLNLENSVIIVDGPKQNTLNDLLILKDTFPTSTILLCKKTMGLSSTSKNKMDVVLVNHSLLCKKEYDEYLASLITLRLKFYVDTIVINNYVDQCETQADDCICVCIDNKIFNLKDFHESSKQNDSIETNEIDIFGSEQCTLTI